MLFVNWYKNRYNIWNDLQGERLIYNIKVSGDWQLATSCELEARSQLLISSSGYPTVSANLPKEQRERCFSHPAHRQLRQSDWYKKGVFSHPVPG